MAASKKMTFSRRSFLKSSALASGGMIIGFNLFNACKADVKPPVDLSQLNYNDFNAFIKISEEGKVTIFSPNPEIGQGVKTSMPMLIAEELDVAWKDVYVQQGKLDTENYQRQVAGGSQSIRHGWEPLRQTGATAKQMLVNAAAARWGVDASECSVSNGVITNAKGETLGYGDVVTEAAILEVPEEVTLKDPKDFKIIGKGKGNVDIDNIITGKPLFGIDYKEEGMLYACVLRPPAFGQVLESFDDSVALALPGVVAVITIGEKIRAYRDSGKSNWSMQMSSSDKVVVIAKSTWEAMKGQKAIKAIWKTETPLESTETHDKALLALLDGKKFKTRRKDGNVKKAFAAADKVIERVYEAPFLPHNTMEPMNFFANVTPEKVHLVGPVQTPEAAAKVVSELLERDLQDVHLEMTRMGGGFGRRLYGDFVYEAAEISNAIKKPIKVVSSREDDMTTGVYRPSTKYKIAASIKDGKVTGYHLKEACVNGNMYGLIPNFFPAGAIENYQVDTANYKSNITTGAWRAPYTNFLASAEQSFFDELAEELGMDRVQLHMDLLDNVKKNPEANIEYSPDRLQAVLKLAVEKSNWGNTEEGVYQGLSVYYCHNSHVAEVADITMENGIPNVKRVTCAVDCGIVVNPLGAMNQAKGGVIDGIGHALYSDFGFNNGVPQSNNFNTYQLIRMGQTPKVDVHFIENNIDPTGLGEPTLPPIGAAVANAIYKATGKRLTKQPYMSNMNVENSVVG
ncbi:xanthine dehydrogenase family protein molybdopterin-binding subunit [Algibacter amylolyticus]|uniref:Xanthine dehydrogenase family protein molybdopterin-binding subunit n=1 Tax=Algibacter amylolyticus TaxID=1608400 RepID=A0A5M7AY70_9FLAO|nr:molybdopterin cofactor-binding domain-containing protein [Algibacter amylolyticus]KAA5822353.1 xanthine dehydrogenase family protein molybdopterin-binding subunit [Algibacter amylolyticus]MBB5269071.1 isoquinoline 1-oxidoreductase beta subunit [Algibacter amylolyticus]TSJ73503.1 xanthine dehydrogenase family protein molybdopterin-binding subunit [Algibacter amylolyticus]